MANPNIPIAGAITLPVVETCTSKNPIIGPVQEKDTRDNVNAIRKILAAHRRFRFAIHSITPFRRQSKFKCPKERSCKNNQHQEKKNIEYGIR